MCVLVIYIYITMYSSNFSCANIKYLHIWPDVRSRTLSFCLAAGPTTVPLLPGVCWPCGAHGWTLSPGCARPMRASGQRTRSVTKLQEFRCQAIALVKFYRFYQVLSIWPFLELLVSSAGLHRPSRGPNAWGKTRFWRQGWWSLPCSSQFITVMWLQSAIPQVWIMTIWVVLTVNFGTLW